MLKLTPLASQGTIEDAERYINRIEDEATKSPGRNCWYVFSRKKYGASVRQSLKFTIDYFSIGLIYELKIVANSVTSQERFDIRRAQLIAQSGPAPLSRIEAIIFSPDNNPDL